MPDELGALARWLTTERPVSIWALVCSGLLPLLLTGGWLLADSLQPPSYSPVRQSVSVLAGHAGTDRWIMTGALYVIGVCYLANAAAVSALGPVARIGLLIAGLTGIGVASCPEPVRGSTAQHLAFTTIGAVVIAAWPALVPRRRPAPRPSSVLSRRTALTVTAGFLALLAWNFFEALRGSELGLAERTSSSIELCWPFVIVLALRRREKRVRTESATATGGA